MSQTKRRIALASVGLVFLAPGVAAIRYVYAASPIVITPSDPSWWFLEETPNGSGTFVGGPSTPPLGSASVQLTVDGTGGEDFGTLDYAGVLLKSITSLSYSTYRSSGTSALAPALDFDVDTDASTTVWEGRLVYEPYYTHTVLTGVWQTWNPLDNAAPGNWWFTGAPGNATCPISAPCTWAEILASFPNAGIRPPAEMGETIFKAGGGWTGGFVGDIDAFSIGINNVVTTYDFELSLPVPTSTQSPPVTTPITVSGQTATNGGPAPANAYFYGQAYPGSMVEVFQKSGVTGPYESIPLTSVSIDADGMFQAVIQNFLQANYFFAIQAVDKDGGESQLLPLVSQFIPSGNDLILNNILIPPTIEVAPSVVSLGQPVNISGYAAPSSTVEIWIDGILQGEATSDVSGLYAFATSTTQFSIVNHTVEARYILPNGAESDFSLEKTFSISTLALPKLDLNGDGVINAADLSIFLFRWNSTDTALQSSIEFDGTDKVDISDLSILLNAMRLQ
jgi:hypothetical protein